MSILVPPRFCNYPFYGNPKLSSIMKIRNRKRYHQRTTFKKVLKCVSPWLIVFCARCATCALDVSMRNICARFAQDCTYFSNAQYIRKIAVKWAYQCAIYSQDCNSFSNAQYMPKICARLYFFLQCAIYVH